MQYMPQIVGLDFLDILIFGAISISVREFHPENDKSENQFSMPKHEQILDSFIDLGECECMQ